MELKLLQLIFNATNWANIADNTATAPVTVWYPSLQTAAVSDTTTTQSVSEAAYTGYLSGSNRTGSAARTSGGWTCATGAGVSTAINAATISYGVATAGTPETETYIVIGPALSGAGTAYLWGQLTNSLVVNIGITPQFAAGALVCEAK